VRVFGVIIESVPIFTPRSTSGGLLRIPSVFEKGLEGNGRNVLKAKEFLVWYRFFDRGKNHHRNLNLDFGLFRYAYQVQIFGSL